MTQQQERDLAELVWSYRRMLISPPGFTRAGKCEGCALHEWQMSRPVPYVERLRAMRSDWGD